MRGWLVASLLGATIALAGASADTTSDQKSDACQGSPADAVMALPAPLNVWGRLLCTPYGHVVAANEGWIWTPPGTFAPVFFPAQMVQDAPLPIGNDAYFTKIAMTAVEGEEAAMPLNAVRTIFNSMKPPRETYRLELVSSSGRSLRIYFLADNTLTGIWCQEECNPKSFFMVLGPRSPAK